MDEAQKVVLDMGAGVSGQFWFVQHELYVFIRIDDDIAVHNLVNDFQVIGQVCIIADDRAFDMDIFVQNDIVSNDGRTVDRAIVFDTDVVAKENGVFLGRVSFIVFIEGATAHDYGGAAEDDIVFRLVAGEAAFFCAVEQ